MDIFEKNMIDKVGLEGFKKIQKTRVGIAGAGGLGSNCAAYLVRAGFKKITIVDFDKVDVSNLDRQFYFLDQVGMFKVEALAINLLRINPDLELITSKEKIDGGCVRDIFKNCDCFVECLDRADDKSMFVGALLSSGKLIVSVSGLGGVGSSDAIKMRQFKSNLVVIGDLESDVAYAPALAPRVSVAAAKQADIVLEYVLAGHIKI